MLIRPLLPAYWAPVEPRCRRRQNVPLGYRNPTIKPPTWPTLRPPFTDGTMEMSLTTTTPAATDRRGDRFHDRRYIRRVLAAEPP